MNTTGKYYGMQHRADRIERDATREFEREFERIGINDEGMANVESSCGLYKELVRRGFINDGDEVMEYLDEEYVEIADDKFIKDDLALLVGAAVALVGIVCITVDVSFLLSMYQTVGWIS
jgi:hypothetical protein